MKTATLLFTYNRSVHTEQVLDALKNNSVLPEKLIIFQDGLDKEGHRDDCEWHKVNRLIHSIDWCDKEVIISDYNKGLSDSIVAGINYAFQEYEAVIVLEDDCVPAVDFIKFMEQCFTEYKENRYVYSVSGYSWPIPVEKNQYDVYTCGRICTWGWGTWKDKWRVYNKDPDILRRIKKDKIKSRNLAMWGSDCEKMLLDKIAGNNDSWAIYWGLIIIENEGICINPYESLIQNIGIDGSGVHCGISDEFQVKISESLKNKFKLLEDIAILNNTKEAFASLYGNYTSINEDNGLKEKILVYGLGNFFLQYEKDINEKYYIEAFVDRKKKGWYAGKKIIRMKDICAQKYDKILIMVHDIQECINVTTNLILENIYADKILIGHSYYGIFNKYIDCFLVLPDGFLSILIGKITVKIKSWEDFKCAYDVLVKQTYQYCFYNDKMDVVLDVGMNIGVSALYFLNCKKVKKVYAYEPFLEAYLAAKDNLKNNMEFSNRIEIMQYGISNADDNEKKEINKKVKDAAEEFLPIIQRHSDCNIVLKMDCKEEFEAIEELASKNILPFISLIMLEWQNKGKDHILSILKKEGFSYWCLEKDQNRGVIYAVNMKGEIYC